MEMTHHSYGDICCLYMQLFIRVQSTPVNKDVNACIGFTLANFLPPIFILLILNRQSDSKGIVCILFKDVTKMESLEDGLSKHEMYVCIAAALITHCGRFIANCFLVLYGTQEWI